MKDPAIKVVIPFRDRGQDLRRGANLAVVVAWWWAHGIHPVVQSDEEDEGAQFNRHRAYNLAVEASPETDVFVFTEADMLIHPKQILAACREAYTRPGLVVPFTQYRYLSDEVTSGIRDTFHELPSAELAEWWTQEPELLTSIFHVNAESTMDNGRSIGAVNVMSSKAIELAGGFTEATTGNWYDDNIVEEAFAYLTDTPTRWVQGPAVHLYHLPGWKGDHLTDADKQATARNKELLELVRHYIRENQPDVVREIMLVRKKAEA